MNSINGFALAFLIVLTLLDMALLFYVFPKNLREVRRGRSEYTVLRWVIFNVTLSMILFSVIPIAYQAVRLTEPTPHMDLFRALTSSSWVLLVLSFMVGWVSVHAASDMLIRRARRQNNGKDS